MAYLPTNSTNTPLGANQSFIGESYQIDKEYISITCSFNSNVGGILEFFHSIDGFSFSTYGDVYDFIDKPGSHSIEVSVKGKFFKIKFTNGLTPQTSFNLFCKLNKEVAESILNSIYDSVGVVNAEEGGLNIRLLTTDDEVKLPQLDPIIINDSGATCLNVRVNSMPPITIPPITISSVSITDSNGNNILSNSSGYLQTEIMNTSLSVSGSVSVSNQISGYALNSTLTSTNSKLDSLINNVRITATNGNSISSANGNLLVNLYANGSQGYQPLSSGTPQNTTFNCLRTMGENGIKASLGGLGYVDLNAVAVSGRGTSLYVDETNSSAILSGITGIQNILSNQGITGSIYITNPSLNVDTGLTMIYINNETLNVDTGLTMMYINNDVINVDTGLTMMYINNDVINVDTGLTMMYINNDVLNVDTGLTMMYINNESLKVDTGLTMIHINNESLDVHINNETLNVDTGLTMMYINNDVLNVDTGLTMMYINNTSPIGITGTVFVSNFSDIQINSDSLIQAITDSGGATSLNCYTDTNNNNRHYLYTNDKLLNDKITNTLTSGEVGTQVYITNTMAHPVNVGLHATHNTTITDLHCSSQGGLYVVPTDESGHHQLIDNNGSAQVGLFDTQGHAIGSDQISGALYGIWTSNKQLNDAFNITNSAINTSIVNAPLVKLEDGSGNALTSQVLAATRSLDVAVNNKIDTNLYGSVSTVSTKLTATQNSPKVGLDVNVINSGNIATSDSYLASSYDLTNTAIKVNMVANTGGINIRDSDSNKILVDGSTTNNLKTVDKNIASAYVSAGTAVAVACKSYTGAGYVNNSCDANGYQNMNVMNTATVKISDTAGHDIASIPTAGAVLGSVKTVLIGQTNNANIGDSSSSYDGISKIGINAFISNGATTPAIVGGVIGTSGTTPKPLKLDANNNLSTVIDSTGNSIKVSDGTYTASVRDIGTSHPTYQIRGLETCANLYATEVSLGSNQPLTCTYNAGFMKNLLNVNDIEAVQYLTAISGYTLSSRDSLTAMNTKMTQQYNTTNNAKDYIIGGIDANNKIGLNTYQIFPKKLYYNMGGYSAYNAGNALMGSWGNNLTINNLSTSNSIWYWVLDSSTTGTWTIIYDYVDASGGLVPNQSQAVATTNNGATTYVPIAGGVSMKGVIKWKFDTYRAVSYNLYITPSNSSSAPLGITYSVGGGNAGGQSTTLNGVMIVPTGYVAYIPQLSYVGGANMNVCLVKFTDTTGSGGTSSPRQLLNKFYYVNLTSKEITAGSGGGGIGGVFMPGDRFCLMTIDSTATSRWSNIDVVLEAI